MTDAPSPRPPRSTTIAPPRTSAGIRPVCRVSGRDDAGPRRGPPARSSPRSPHISPNTTNPCSGLDAGAVRAGTARECAGRRGLTHWPRAPRLSARHERVPRSRRSRGDCAGVGIRVRVIPAPRDARLRPPTPVGRSPTSRHVAPSPSADGAAGRRDRQSRAVAHAALPRGGVRDGVPPLWVLLAGAGLLRGALPRDRATGPTAARDRAAPAEPEEGRLDHRDRQRAYRARCRRRGVTDAPSPRPPRSTTIAPPRTSAGIRPVCRVCGRVWPRRAARREPPARQGGAQRRKAPDNANS